MVLGNQLQFGANMEPKLSYIRFTDDLIVFSKHFDMDLNLWSQVLNQVYDIYHSMENKW
jgi:hypothetical protein